MARPDYEAQELQFELQRKSQKGLQRELQKGFQTNVRQAMAARHANTYVTLLMASGLTLATLIAVAIVSIEVVTAAALH